MIPLVADDTLAAIAKKNRLGALGAPHPLEPATVAITEKADRGLRIVVRFVIHRRDPMSSFWKTRLYGMRFA